MLLGFPRRWLAETGSTNTVAGQWAAAGAPDGAVVMARCQLQGRGRRERKWASPPGCGLYFSMILRPGWPAAEAPNLAILGGMAAYRALESVAVPNLRIKWPNDVLAGGKKICGVLVEPRLDAGRIEYAVVGIGIDVKQSRKDFSPELRDLATSCHLEGVDLGVDRMAEVLIDSIQRVRKEPMDRLRADWRAACARDEEPEI